MDDSSAPSSKGQKNDLAAPLLLVTRGPDQEQIVNHGTRRASLMHHHQPSHRSSGVNSKLGMRGHRIHVVGDDDQSVLRAEFQDVGIGRVGQTEFPYAWKVDDGLASEQSLPNMLVQVVVGEKSRSSHEFCSTADCFTFESLWVSGEFRSAAPLRNLAQWTSWLRRYSSTSDLCAR